MWYVLIIMLAVIASLVIFFKIPYSKTRTE